MSEQEHIGSVAMGDSSAPPCWWIDHGSHGQITQREDEATAAIDEGKKVVRYFSDRPVQEPVAWCGVGADGVPYITQRRDVAYQWLSEGIEVEPLIHAAPQPAHGTSATERVQNKPQLMGDMQYLPPSPAPNAVTAGQGVEVKPIYAAVVEARQIGTQDREFTREAVRLSSDKYLMSDGEAVIDRLATELDRLRQTGVYSSGHGDGWRSGQKQLRDSVQAIAEDFIPDRDEDAPMALQEMRDALLAVISASEASPEQLRSRPFAAPQPAHGTSATERVVDVDVRGIETSIDTMREAAWNLLVKQGWKPGSQLSGHSAVGLMAEFGMRVYRGEVGCDYPSCGCCADAACQDAVSQHPDLGGTLPASTPEVKPMEWTVFCSRSGNSQAETPLGQYVLQYEGLGFGALWMLYLPYKDTSTGKGYETIEAAKAAAQADYEQRILSALSTPTPKEESK